MMRLLDLYCGAGGAAMGYYQAGFKHIVGVDNEPQRRYPFIFVQADALAYLEKWGREFDFIHASPPCQAYSVLKGMTTKKHPELVTETREGLQASRKPYVIENVPGAPLHASLLLCGSMFGLGTGDAQLRRHRLFECSMLIMAPGYCDHGGRPIGVYGRTPRDPEIESRRRKPKTITVTGSTPQQNVVRNQIRETFSVNQAREAMGISWMSMAELSQAIPPAYTRYIGEQVLLHLRAK